MDRKVSQLPAHTTPTGVDLLPIVDYDPVGTSISKSISLNKLFSSITSNTNISSNLSVGANTTLTRLAINSNGFSVSNKYTPSNSSDAAPNVGKWFYDDNYLYIKVSSGVIKRVALNSF